jgi:hypothetical protein
MKEAASIGGLFLKEELRLPSYRHFAGYEPRFAILKSVQKQRRSYCRFAIATGNGGDAVEHQVKMLRQSDGLSMM